MKTLKEFLTCLTTLSEPDIWKGSNNNINSEHVHLQKILSKNFVYGANTLPGHRDNEHTNGEKGYDLQEDIINSHTIGSEPYYSKYTSRCIGYAKIYSWSAGGSGISPTLYNNIINVITHNNFHPKIPKYSSYSSGDVIPGSHWTKEVLAFIEDSNNPKVKPGEIMALINGSFIQIGYAASLVNKIKHAWILYLELTAINNIAIKANTANLSFAANQSRHMAKSAIHYIRSFSNNNINVNEIQDPVSVRAIPQIMDTFCLGIEDYLNEIDYLLNMPSGNPLVSTDYDFTISQASFLAPTLSIKIGSLIENILFVMWSVLGRTNYLLSGKANNIPVDAANKNSKLGLIQYPKLMMAILEKSRFDNGRRIFSSGSQTSYGVEDLWTNGIFALDQLDNLLDDFINFCSLEATILSFVSKEFDVPEIKNNEILRLLDNCSSSTERCLSIKKYLTDDGLKKYQNLFPV